MNKKGKKLDKIILLKWAVVPVLFLCAIIVFNMSSVSYAKYYNEFKENNGANIAVMATDVTIEYLLSDLCLYPGSEISLPVNMQESWSKTR